MTKEYTLLHLSDNTVVMVDDLPAEIGDIKYSMHTGQVLKVVSLYQCDPNKSYPKVIAATPKIDGVPLLEMPEEDNLRKAFKAGIDAERSNTGVSALPSLYLQEQYEAFLADLKKPYSKAIVEMENGQPKQENGIVKPVKLIR